MAGRVLKPEELGPLRELCLRSTYAFGKFICNFSDFDPDVHQRMGGWIDDEGSRFKLGQAPRGFFKSSTWTIANKLRRVTVNPNLRVLLSNETEANTSEWIGVMQRILTSPVYRGFFPDRVPDLSKGRYRWNATAIELRREENWPEATFEGIGVGGASTSRHYDIIVNDDLVGREARESPSVMAKAIDHRKLCWSLMVNASKSEVHDYGTRWATHDVIDFVLKTVKGVDHFLIDIEDENGNPTWPTRYPRPVIEQIREEQGAEMYALQYRNRAVGGGASKFDPESIRPCDIREGDGQTLLYLEASGKTKVVDLADCLVFQIVDAGLSPESENARTANVVAAITPPTATAPFDVVFLEAKATKSSPEQVLEEAYDTYQRWKPLSVSIETFGGHQAFYYWALSTYPGMPLLELKKDFSANAKKKRINSFWGTYPNQGRVYAPRRGMNDLRDEHVSYPHGTTVDLLDAAGYLPSVWVPPEPKKEATQKKYSDFDLADDLDEKDFIGQGGIRDGRSSLTGY